MPNLLTALRSLNRKERFLLLQWVLDRPGFPLGDGFREKLETACDLDLSGEAVVTMDYHLDWVYAALKWATEDLMPGRQIVRDSDDIPTTEDDERPYLITGSQEDVDLLVAAAGPKETTNLIFCEAKAYSPDDYDQLHHKVKRLGAMFGPDGNAFPGVVPRLVLLGPKKPDPNVTKDWPAWTTRPDGTARFIPLPPPEGRYAIRRQHSAKDWTWWTIAPSPWKD